MRLLHRSDTGEITLTRDLHSNIPPYVILSHTWGPDIEELSFQEFTQGSGRDKAGYEKIRLCAEQASRNGLQYCWVDTCCIDKSSSAELSEAINSMFAWYGDSTVCYVYLNDVVIEADPPWLLPDDGHMEEDETEKLESSSLAKSRWFTRGWTLQELLAPKSIEFYDKDWKHLGTLKDLLAAVAHITKIDQEALASKWASLDFGRFCVARRMSWAAKRKTTRLEDQAYCLMGLFDVKMPLLYGEGSHAFKRLQEEILKNTDDESLLAWRISPHLSDYTQDRLLAPSPAYFSGCEKLIRISWDSRNNPWFMSNLGLTMTTTLIPDDEFHCFALLDCRSEQFSEQVLGLWTSLWGARSIKDAERLLPGPAHGRRITELTLGDIDGAKDVSMNKSVLLLRQSGGDFEHSMWSASVTVTLDIALSSQNTRHSIEIEDCYPSRAWDRDSKKLLVVDGSSAARLAAVRLKFGRDKLLLLIRHVCVESLWHDEGMGEPVLIRFPGSLTMRALITQLPKLVKEKRRRYRGPLEFRYMHRKDSPAPFDLLLRAYLTDKKRSSKNSTKASAEANAEVDSIAHIPGTGEVLDLYQPLKHDFKPEKQLE